MEAELTEKLPLTICVIGPTGTGKSSTCNSFFRCRSDDLFKVGSSLSSTTTDTALEQRPWRGSGQLVRCVDSPGLGDSEGRDNQHVNAMVSFLKEQVKQVHVFLILFNGMEPKLNSHLKSMLLQFKDIFGEEFLRNVMIGFTRWEYTKLARKHRAIKKQSNEIKAKEMNALLRDMLGHEFDCPCVFLDNNVNSFSDENLEEFFGDELQDVLCEFEAELSNVYDFARSRAPFACQDVVSVMANRETMKKKVQLALEFGDSISAEKLGRQLDFEQQDFIRGTLWWRRNLRFRRIFAVLRRKELRFFKDESEEEPDGPEYLDLAGCICAGLPASFLGYPCFTLYRPQERNRIGDFRIDFATASEREQKRWVLLLQEATQISKSCAKIEQFQNRLQAATTGPEYARCIDMVAAETIVIPVEWVQQHSKSSKNHVTTMEQAADDLTRDSVKVDGRLHRCPNVADLTTDVALRLLGIMQAQSAIPQDVEAKAIMLAKDVVRSCSRTEGGDILDAVRLLLNREGLVHFTPDAGAAGPVSVSILRPGGSESVLSENTMHSMESCSTGLPQFKDDTTTELLNFDRVKAMALDSDQELQVVAADRSKWVPDWEGLQCMRCGALFHALLRRHHCRKCGALVCRTCSQHYVSLQDAPTPQVSKSRQRPSLTSPLTMPSLLVQMEFHADPISLGFLANGVDPVPERVPEEPIAPPKPAMMGRVCFVCYNKAVIDDLTKRKIEKSERSSGSLMVESSAPDVGDATCKSAPQHEEGDSPTSTSPLTSFPGVSDSEAPEEDSSLWPPISVEMGARYRILSEPDLDVLFHVDCRYVRQVRWSGLYDAGKVILSISRPEPTR
mmetsp:Transcript_40779/g.73662  ORF Transcript_40779/g.73662 Transcript_40779/m.73662 type:complete len:844 (-) Transcript_40779:67-2598(-)